MGKQTTESETSSSESVKKAECPHISRIISVDSPLAKIDSSAFKKQVATGTLRCELCENKIPRLWVCLHSRCRKVICSSSTRTHMRTHFDKENCEEECHSLYVNPRTLEIWCYACGTELNPFDKAELLSSKSRDYLITIVRSLQGKRQKQQPTVVEKIAADVPGLVGLKNLGNTCYMNAALQALSNTPALTDYFNYCEAYLPRHPAHRLGERFSHFVRAMWDGKSPIFVPTQLVIEIKKYDLFQGYGQQDTQEFLRYILDRLHEELPYPRPPSHGNGNGLYLKTPQYIDGAGNSSSNSSTASMTTTQSTTTRFSSLEKVGKLHSSPRSVINDVFGGVYESHIKCLHCKKDFLKEEHFYDLQIQIDKKFKIKSDKNGEPSNFLGWIGVGSRTIRLQDCLAAYCTTENLTGSDRYRCDRCKKLNDCQKTLKIKKLPETLCIQLKRFRYDTYFPSKISTHVQFPMEDLDMRPYCKFTERSRNENSNSVDEQYDASLNVTSYDLYALVQHRGGLGGGHYIAYAKNRIDNNWYEYDDTYVTRKNPLEIPRLEAYVLFYQKKSLEKEEERRIISNRIRKDVKSEPIYYISRLWFSRWKFMTTPGPVTNYDFMCRHGAVNSIRNRHLRDMVVKVPSGVYSTFIDTYGNDGSQCLAEANTEIAGCRICEQEEKLLAERRIRERRDVESIDSSPARQNEYWFLISAAWLNSWQMFKNGGPLPSAIDNTTFLKEDSTPKRGMRRGIDYRCVNERTWWYFHKIYGGGPFCVRAAFDLYSPAIQIVPPHVGTNHNSYHDRDG